MVRVGIAEAALAHLVGVVLVAVLGKAVGVDALFLEVLHLVALRGSTFFGKAGFLGAPATLTKEVEEQRAAGKGHEATGSGVDANLGAGRQGGPLLADGLFRFLVEGLEGGRVAAAGVFLLACCSPTFLSSCGTSWNTMEHQVTPLGVGLLTRRC